MSNFLRYKPIENGYQVIGKLSGIEPENVTIPSHYNGTQIVAIGNSAFVRCTSLREVHIMAKITEIDTYAFFGCYNLRYINIPASCSVIGVSAIDCRFDNIYNTGSLVIVFDPGCSLKTLKNAAIANCANFIVYVYDKVHPENKFRISSALKDYTVTIYSPYKYIFTI